MTSTVAVLIDDHAHGFELGMVHRLLKTAVDRRGQPAYRVCTCTADGRPVRSDDGFLIEPDGDAALLAAARTVIVIPSPQHTELTATSGPGLVGRALTGLRESTRVMSICLASFALAAAGLLDGRRATTHWAVADRFARAFPLVDVDPAPLFVEDGNITTSAGAAAGIDMVLQLIRTDHGSEAANEVARRLVVPSWREGGQQQYIDRPIAETMAGDLSATLDWATSRIHEPLGLNDLAGHARMSRRTFTRAFRASQGTSPTQWLLARRLDLAKRLLETTADTIDVVAEKSGFGSTNALRSHLREQVGVSPSAYRKTFRQRP